MTELFKTVLSLSISASLLAAVLFALRPVYRERLSKRWQYYIWLVVIARLLAPVTLDQNLIGELFARTDRATSIQEEYTAPARTEAPAVAQQEVEMRTTSDRSPAAALPAPEPDTASRGSGTGPQIKRFLEQHLWQAWAAIALMLLVRKVTNYHSFLRFIKAGSHRVDDADTLQLYQAVCADLGVKGPPPIHRNKLAVSPMLVGILRPCIILPELDVDSEELQLVLRHELVHHRRRDILYKWLTQLALCLHWFNPVVHLVAREIGRSCELSCDEAILGALPADNQRRYGDTLLATLKTGGTYGDAAASLTMSEDGKQLKERLGAILKFRPGTRLSRGIAISLALVLLCTAAFLGAYVGTSSTVEVRAQTSAPIILPRNEYTHLATVTGGKSVSVLFQVRNPNTALYIVQENEGQFSLAVRSEKTGRTVVSGDAVSYFENTEPVLVFTAAEGIYTLELNCPTDWSGSVTVYGAGMDKADSYKNFDLSSILKIPATITRSVVEGVLDGVVDGIVDGLAESIDGTARWAEDWAEGWEDWAEDWADGWEDWASGWEDDWDFDWDWNNDSWRTLEGIYRDGYLIEVGSPNHESASSYDNTIQMTVGGNTHQVGFRPDAEAFRQDQKVLNLVREILEESYRQSWSGHFFVVRSVIHNPDPEALLRDTYERNEYIQFVTMAEHCQGAVIEELLYRSYEDNQDLFFLAMAEQLPSSFTGAEDLARGAAEKGRIIMLSALERFLSESLMDELTMQCIGLDTAKLPAIPRAPELPKAPEIPTHSN